MMLKKWEELPAYMQTDAVRPYYDALRKKRGSLFAKRIFDIAVSGLFLALLSPLFAALAIAIKADSQGPVFFRQTRITQYGREFRIFKFRTMDAENTGTQVTAGGDSRITKVGSFLRSSRLDEIPQLLNVLLGHMSLVGTRPEVPEFVAAYTPKMLATLLLPAGITSKASILYKDEEALLRGAKDVHKCYIETVLPEKMKCNLHDVLHFSFWGDIAICFETVFAVLK